MFYKKFKIATTDDTAPCCTHCRGTLLFIKRTKISHCYQNNASKTMFHKFLLIYAMLLVTFSPAVICTRLGDLQTGNVLSQVTTSTNSIDKHVALVGKSEIIYDDGDTYDESDENQSDYELSRSEISRSDVRKEYEKQFKAFPKSTDRNAGKSSHDVTTLPTLSSDSSCSSTACFARKDIEDASTESIRKHILMKLGMEHEPNKTNYPKLSEEFKERLCKKINISPADCLGKKPTNVEYQSDDPIDSHYDDYLGEQETTIENEEDVQFLSFENRIYAFPSTTIKPRHKSHMIFQFTESQEMNNIVSQATLNLFLHSRKYLRSLTDSQIPKNLRCVDIEIARILQGSQHKLIFETFRNISVPDGGNDGDYVQLNITDLVAEWFSSHETSHSLSVKIIECKSGATMPHKIVGLDVESFATRPFIEILPRDQRKKRTKRSLRCLKGSSESRCCRHELTVDFDKFGWDWIIAPKKYDANYCAGECKIAFMQQYAHTHVMQLSTAANPCCSPRKMTPMQLLYFDSQLNIVLGTIPNMIVEECFCS